MSFFDLIQQLVRETPQDLARFRPELTICATIVLILLLRIIPLTRRIESFYVAFAGALIGLAFAGADFPAAAQRSEVFTGLLVFDQFAVFVRIALFVFLVLFCIFTRLSGIPDADAATDFFPLVLGATLGMCLMASANHMLTVFLGVEMASVPSYALAGALKGRRQSGEAALKYAVYGAGAAGVMLYGISLLSGIVGSAHLPTMAARLADMFQHADMSDKYMVLALSGLMVMVGLAFKLSAVPFHFWCPDVFEGASAEVNAFLSVASKAAALALLVRVTLGLSCYAPNDAPTPPPAVAATVADSPSTANDPSAPFVLAASQGNVARNDVSVSDSGSAPAANAGASEMNASLAPVRDFASKLVAFLAVITCTFGNLAAYGQTNIKRLLAYSTIAHAGYMMMPVAAALALAGDHPDSAARAIGALGLYISVYLFMNLGAFAVVAFLRNTLGSEEIADYSGLIHRMPIVVICFATILVSLLGLPPLAGFVGKFAVFASLWEAGLRTVLVIGGINTAISLYYYLRVVKVMTIDPEPSHRVPAVFPFIPGTFVVALTLPVFILGIWFNELLALANSVSAQLFS